MTGVDLIYQERQEQIHKHHMTVEHDVAMNDEKQLVEGAKALLNNLYLVPRGWNKDIFRHILSKPIKERLAVVGALIAAEIDRLQKIEEIMK